MSDSVSDWSDRYFAMHLDGSVAGVIWIHLDEYTVGPTNRRSWLFRRGSAPAEGHQKFWVTVAYAYGPAPDQVDYTDDLVAGTIEEAGFLWKHGDTHEVEDWNGIRRYQVETLPPDQAAWVQSWFRTV